MCVGNDLAAPWNLQLEVLRISIIHLIHVKSDSTHLSPLFLLIVSYVISGEEKSIQQNGSM